MKRMVFGLGLLLSGVIGFTGWCIAAALTFQPGSRSHILSCLAGDEWLLLLLFAAMAIAGFVIAFLELNKGE